MRDYELYKLKVIINNLSALRVPKTSVLRMLQNNSHQNPYYVFYVLKAVYVYAYMVSTCKSFTRTSTRLHVLVRFISLKTEKGLGRP